MLTDTLIMSKNIRSPLSLLLHKSFFVSDSLIKPTRTNAFPLCASYNSKMCIITSIQVVRNE